MYEHLITDHDPDQDTDHLARRLELTEDDVRTALKRLEELNLVQPTGDGPARPVDPRLGLKALLFRQMSGIEAQLLAFEQDRAAVLTLVDKYARHAGHRGAAEGVGGEYVTGREAVAGRLSELADAAGTEWLAFAPGGAPSVSWLESVQSLVRQVRGRGVAARTVSTDSIRGGTQWADLPRTGVRTVPSLPVPMLIVDRSTALLPTEPAAPWRGVLQLSAPGVLEALIALFEGVWASAVPLGGVEARPAEGGLNPREREVLRLLARGLNDDAVRRRLGLSLRTVRRIVADLCTRLGAASRFEAGYLAAKRGWI
ncbi:helix-turn-helix transcriptional regulator [Streptomyces davaonensis]|uniref:helix-turn-helix transcriptional regulator n=1 Tax=Streptomyces davaonensis TaxID=348043 RepID=UPI000348F98E|nr:LuxR C-terminal-related transcriptional regulator [Streptomyces davaonensis]